MKKAYVALFFLILLLSCNLVLAQENIGQKASDIVIKQWLTTAQPDIDNLYGKVYIVEFWTTWCKSCVQSIPHLNQLYAKYEKQGLEFISLSEDKSTEKVKKMISKKGIKYPVAIDNGTIDWFEIKAYPSMVLVDHRGIIVWRGYPWSEGLEKAISKALNAAPPAIVAGVELGFFDKYKDKLKGGANFKSTYYEIMSYIGDLENPNIANSASYIIDTIDYRLSKQIQEADLIRSKDPYKALHIYKEMVDKYGGIYVVAPAQNAYVKLKNELLGGNRILATQAAYK